MKECPYCHAKLSDEASFCLYCMKELNRREVVRAEEKPRRNLFVPILAVSLALLAGLILFLTLRPSDQLHARSFALPQFSVFQENYEYAAERSHAPQIAWSPEMTMVHENFLRDVLPEKLTFDWHEGASDAFPGVFSLGWSDASESAAFYADNCTPMTYEDVLSAARSFTDAAFQQLTYNFYDLLREDNSSWTEKTAGGKRIKELVLRPENEPGTVVQIITNRLSPTANTPFFFLLLIIPELS